MKTAGFSASATTPADTGHNYVVEVTVAGMPDERTGVVLSLPCFEQVVKERVIDLLDHKHLNLDTDEFHALNPTVENIARVIWEKLNEQVPPARLHNVRVFETPKTWGGLSWSVIRLLRGTCPFVDACMNTRQTPLATEWCCCLTLEQLVHETCQVAVNPRGDRFGGSR